MTTDEESVVLNTPEACTCGTEFPNMRGKEKGMYVCPKCGKKYKFRFRPGVLSPP